MRELKEYTIDANTFRYVTTDNRNGLINLAAVEEVYEGWSKEVYFDREANLVDVPTIVVTFRSGREVTFTADLNMLKNVYHKLAIGVYRVRP